MPPHSNDMVTLPLGELLRETRIKQGLDIESVAEGTRISPKNLQAIEDGNFAALPAEVFTRGFYTLYARHLALDPKEILTLYAQERKILPKETPYKTPPPNRLAENMKNLADRPSSLPFAYFGFVLLLLLSFGAFLCWYFSWNPASYLSIKLRSFDAIQQVEQVKSQGSQPVVLQSIFALAQSRKTTPAHPTDLMSLSSPSTATAATTQPDERLGNLPSSGITKYHVNAVFQEETMISLTIDDTPLRTMTFQEGEQVSWRAVEKLTITLPVNTRTKISLNQIPLELPKPDKNHITLTIPEYLLR
ncbi:MAG: helix-turn-helix domain-containing protein [Proteobacteria bacterium]|nr:helix-turn-helix domain-containing protein [Pseudomonadota bacterium]